MYCSNLSLFSFAVMGNISKKYFHCRYFGRRKGRDHQIQVTGKEPLLVDFRSFFACIIVNFSGTGAFSLLILSTANRIDLFLLVLIEYALV